MSPVGGERWEELGCFYFFFSFVALARVLPPVALAAGSRGVCGFSLSVISYAPSQQVTLELHSPATYIPRRVSLERL